MAYCMLPNMPSDSRKNMQLFKVLRRDVRV